MNARGKTPEWLKWIRACLKDEWSKKRLQLDVPLAALTGQDHRALGVIAACWELYAASDEDGEEGAIQAIRALLPAIQPKCRCYARELIAMAMDWNMREPVWTKVTLPQILERLAIQPAGWASVTVEPAKIKDAHSIREHLRARYTGENHTRESVQTPMVTWAHGGDREDCAVLGICLAKAANLSYEVRIKRGTLFLYVEGTEILPSKPVRGFHDGQASN